MEFTCTKCGICCRHIENIKELAKFNDGTGVCINLDKETNLCKIYDTRPIICRVKESYELKYKDIYTKEQFIQLNLQSCKKLQEKYGL